MARTTLHCVFAALLTMLSSQVGVPSRDAVVAVEIQRCEVEACGLDTQPLALAAGIIKQPMLAYVERIPSEPDTAARFQRPPPSSPLLF